MYMYIVCRDHSAEGHGAESKQRAGQGSQGVLNKLKGVGLVW